MAALTKEQRKERARAKMVKLREASKSNKSADRMDWRPKAKVVFHPDTEIKPRRRIWFPKVVDDKDDDKKGKKGKKGNGKTKVVSVPFNVPFDLEKCPFTLLSKILREDDTIDGEENILCIGTGRNKVELCKGEILGWDGYDYKKSLKVGNDFVAVAVMIENVKKKRPSNLKAVIFSGAKSLGSDIMKEIESEMDESGEELGCPFITPYPFILQYDEDERGSDMYSANARPSDADEVAEDEELMKILNEEPPDIESEIELSSISEMVKAINSAIIYEGLVIEMEGVEDDKDSKTNKAAAKGKSKKSAAKSSAKVKEETEDPAPETEVEVETVSDEDAEAQALAELEAEAEAELEAEALAEIKAEEATKKKALEKEAAAEKAKVDKALKAAKKAAAKAKKEAEKEAADEAALKAAKEVAEKPLTKEEKKATLIAKKKAEIIAKKKAEAAEKAAPVKEEKTEAKKSKKAKKDEPKTETAVELNEDEDYDVCPTCKGKVDQDAKKCPHPGCPAVFVVEGDDPF